MSAKPSLSKYQVVRDQISSAIHLGEWERGAQLPSEHEFAARYGVSYMTARRAVEELLEAGLIERHGRNRTMVRDFEAPKTSRGLLNLIWTPVGNETLRTLLRLCQKEARARDFETRLICWSNGSKRAALSAIADGNPTLVGLGYDDLHGALLTAMQKAATHLVLLGNRLNAEAIPAVKADDAQGMNLAIAHLRALGHRKIGLISNRKQDPIDQLRRTVWEECLKPITSPTERKHWLLHAPVPIGEPLTQITYNCVRAFLESGRADVTALLCVGEQSALGALAACHDSGWAVPEKVSLITFGNSPNLSFLRPSSTVVDVDLERHARLACEMLASGPIEPGRFEMVQPHIVSGQSVAKPPT